MKTRLLLLLPILATLLLLGGVIFLNYSKPSFPALPTPPLSQTSFTKPFTLTNQNGEIVNEKAYLGKPTLYFFGFTHCPDVCPTTLTTLTNWLNQLGEKANQFNVVFISIDPDRDTPATLKTYLSNFHPAISAATGTPQQLETMAKTFMVYYAKVPQPTATNPNEYTMSHSSMILLADKNGIFNGTLDAHDSDEKALAKLNEMLK